MANNSKHHRLLSSPWSRSERSSSASQVIRALHRLSSIRCGFARAVSAPVRRTPPTMHASAEPTGVPRTDSVRRAPPLFAVSHSNKIAWARRPCSLRFCAKRFNRRRTALGISCTLCPIGRHPRRLNRLSHHDLITENRPSPSSDRHFCTFNLVFYFFLYAQYHLSCFNLAFSCMLPHESINMSRRWKLQTTRKFLCKGQPSSILCWIQRCR